METTPLSPLSPTSLLLSIHLHISSIYPFNLSPLSIMRCLFCLSIFSFLSGVIFPLLKSLLNVSSILSFMPVYLSSCLFPLCYQIFLSCPSFYPSCVLRPYASTKFFTTSIGKLLHLSPMCLVSPKAASRRCTDKRQPCQTKATLKRASGFTVRVKPQPSHHALAATSKTCLQ